MEKEGWGVFKAELRQAEVDPRFDTFSLIFRNATHFWPMASL